MNKYPWSFLLPLISILLVLFSEACTELDGLILAAVPVDSLDAYSFMDPQPPLPYTNGEALIERDVFLVPKTGEQIPVAELNEHDSYIHGILLDPLPDCPLTTCPLANRSLTLIYQHGNAGNIGWYWHMAEKFWKWGIRVFFWDYRGYGLSKGNATGEHVLEDMETVLRYLDAKPEVDAERLILYGHSMGAIPSTWAAGKAPYRDILLAIILDAGLDSAQTLFDVSTGTNLPVGYVTNLEMWDGPTWLKDAVCPILHLHGAQDELLSVDRVAMNYYKVLKDHPNYFPIIGTPDTPSEEWIEQGTHGNLNTLPEFTSTVIDFILFALEQRGESG